MISYLSLRTDRTEEAVQGLFFLRMPSSLSWVAMFLREVFDLLRRLIRLMMVCSESLSTTTIFPVAVRL